MNLSQCSISFQTEDKWNDERTLEHAFEDLLPDLKAWGFDGVEAWWPHVENLSEVELGDVVTRLQAFDLQVPMLSGYTDFTTSEASAAASTEVLTRMCAVARRLSCPAIRLFTGSIGSTDSTQAQWRRTVSSIHALCEAHADLTFCLETHSNNLSDRVDTCLRLLADIDQPNAQLIYQADTFFPEHIDALRRLLPFVKHVHALNFTEDANGDRQWCWLQHGAVDFADVFSQLQRAGYQGFVSLEWMGPSPETAALAQAEWVRHLN